MLRSNHDKGVRQGFTVRVEEVNGKFRASSPNAPTIAPVESTIRAVAVSQMTQKLNNAHEKGEI